MPQCVRCQTKTELHENGVPICVSCARGGSQPTRNPPAIAVSRQVDLRDSLLQDLLATTARANAARRVFDSVIDQFPSGLPYPDGTQRIRNASQELEAARKELGRAHNRLNDFLGRGIAPQDLKRAVGQ